MRDGGEREGGREGEMEGEGKEGEREGEKEREKEGFSRMRPFSTYCLQLLLN